MPWFIKTNVVFLVLFFVVSFFSLDAFTIGRILRSLIELVVIFFLPGINLVFLLQCFFKRTFSPLESINIALVFSVFLMPFFLTFEYTKLQILHPTLPLINAILLFILTAGIYFFYHKRSSNNIPAFSLNNASLRNILFSKNFLPPFILYITIVISIVTAYYPLPDLDPYYWLNTYRTQFQTNTITSLNEHRPLFSSLTYIFTQEAHIDFYAYFKYILPAFLLLLIFPTALLAQKFSHPLQKIIIFFFPFASGITIVFLTLPIPQAIANVGLFFFFAFLIYSLITKDGFFYFLGGAVLFFSFFYHEALAIPLAIWVILSLFNYRQTIIQKIKKNKFTAILCILIALQALYAPFLFFSSHIQSFAVALLNARPNFLFPQYYVNVDGNQMGWGDLLGITKYYLFYVGPPLFLTFLTILYSIKNKILRSLLFSYEGKVFIGIFLVFLIIAELLPRFTSIAFLPDRAWVFISMIALFFLVTIFFLPIGKNKFFLWCIILGFSVNIAAAVYINTLKKYMITEQQLASAEWINTNLPENRVIFTVGNDRVLSFFSGSSVINIKDPNFLFDISIFENEFQVKTTPVSETSHKKAIGSLKTAVEKLNTNNTTDIQGIRDTLDQIELINQARNLNETTYPKKSYYIYYATPSAKNPYIDRPYIQKIKNSEQEIIFNHYPEKFQLVYSNQKNHIYLWKIL